MSDAHDTDTHLITAREQLDALYAAPSDAALRKESPVITPEYAAMIAASPFVVLATRGPGGLDASPRGDAPGFVAVRDERTLLLPERRGNHRADSLRNLLTDRASRSSSSSPEWGRRFG